MKSLNRILITTAILAIFGCGDVRPVASRESWTNSILSGSTTLTADATSVTVSVPPLELERSVLLFGISHSNILPRYGQVMGAITDETTLTFERVDSATGSAVNISWQVVVFSRDVRVQRGIADVSNVASVSVPIVSVDTSKAFVLLGGQIAPGGNFNYDDQWSGRLASSTELALELHTAMALQNGGRVAWQVVEMDNAQVTSGSTVLGTSDVSVNVAGSYEPTKDWLIFSTRVDSSNTPSMASALVRGELTDSGLMFHRYESGSNAYVEYFVVKFLSGASVRQISATFAASESQLEISEGASTNAIVTANGRYGRGGATPYNDPMVPLGELDKVGICETTARVSNSSISLTRGSTESSCDLNLSLIVFD